jgi:hypothetical protein
VTDRVATRKGRKVRIVAPGYVVDLKSGIQWLNLGDLHGRRQRWMPRVDGWFSVGSLDRAMKVSDRAEATVTIIKLMLEIGRRA